MQLRLYIDSGSLAGQQFEMSRGTLTIGRRQDSNVKFDSSIDKIVSGNHAKIELRPDGFYLVDNGSTNGTFVNDEVVSERSLVNGDRITFGKNGINARVIINEDAFGSSYQPTEDFRVYGGNEVQFNSAAFPEIPAGERSVAFSVKSIGLGSPEVSERVSNTGKYVGVGIGLLVAVLFGLIVGGIMLLSLGPVAAVLAAFVAFIPGIIYLVPVIWLDRYDPEPFWLLASAFAWGALIAVVAAFIINTIVGMVFAVATNPQIGGIVAAVISAPIVEESAKGLGLFLIAIFFRKYFDGILDGIVFAGVIALGFATVENVKYYGDAMNAGGMGLFIQTFFLRGILSPFAHVTFTAMTGIGLGIARESHNKAVKVIFPIVGLLTAMFLHAMWNGSAVLFGGLFFAFYLVIEIPLFLIFVAFSFYIMWRQNRILKEMLVFDVSRGLISQDHYEKATSAFKSTGWIIQNTFKGKYIPTTRYLRSIGKLGLSYWHIQRATQAQAETASFQQNPVLQAEVQRWRKEVEA
ncbi:MAG: PrsW family glutamic-type intramembrane protease [Pyrinomonadaceae bacterium]